jgi:hypothetical protein
VISDLPDLFWTAVVVIAGTGIALLGMLTARDDGKPGWPRIPAPYPQHPAPAHPAHRARKTPARIYGDALAWLREDERKPARHGDGS